MGSATSKNLHSANDFELILRSAKELEHLLKTRFGAQGKGVNEVCRHSVHWHNHSTCLEGLLLVPQSLFFPLQFF